VRLKPIPVFLFENLAYNLDMSIEKPTIEDLEAIRQILEQWTEPEEVEKYLIRIESEINGSSEFSMNFFVVRGENNVIGIGGLSKPLPIIMSLAKTSHPGEIKILYLDNNNRSRGFGRQMINYLEREAGKQGYKELFVRSAARYEDTAYGFYKNMGYEQIHKLENNMSVFHKII